MPTYLIVNRPPAGYAPSPGSARAWATWFDRLGDHLVDRGNPVFAARTVVGAVGSAGPLGGYTLVTANDLAAATALAADCPAVVAGGGVEIGELTIVNGARPTDFARTLRVDARPEALFEALTDTGGLAAWWTRVTGSGDTGGELRFFFEAPQPCVMRVDRAERPTGVRWTVTACDFLPDWVGTRPTFDLAPDGEATTLHFRHEGLTADLDCIDVCTRGWDHFLGSLCDLVETGHGSPFGSEADRARRR